jgi:hypothetical protein
MPAFYWSVDVAWGLRVGIALMVSASLNHALKLAFLGPRPYWVDARVRPLSSEWSLGAPSGHAQNAVAVWGTLAAWVNRRWAWIAALALSFLIGLSRLYLGLHFPHDVLLGWLIGALILLGLRKGEARLHPWLERSRSTTIILAAFAVSLIFILLSAGLVQAAHGWALPETWRTLAARADAAEEIDPLALSGVVSPAAVFFGMAAGAQLLRRRGGYDARGASAQLAARYLLGLAGLLAIYIGLDMIFPDGKDLLALAFRYLRYMLVGLWVTLLAPEVFIRIGLARRSADAPTAQLAGRTA